MARFRVRSGRLAVRTGPVKSLSGLQSEASHCLIRQPVAEVRRKEINGDAVGIAVVQQSRVYIVFPFECDWYDLALTMAAPKGGGAMVEG